MASLAAAALLLAPLADAKQEKGEPIGGGDDHKPYESPQHFAAELRFSPYTPRIDSEPALNGATPYANAFGTTPRLMASLELDWQALRIPYVGTLGPGLGVGYTAMNGTVTTTTGRASGDETALDIYPFWGVAALRADVFYRELGIPLVPHAKLGASYALWRASNTGETSEAANPGSNQSVSGKGHTWGTMVAFGVSFALDSIDRGAARNFDETLGINHTYIFAEYYFLGLNGIGQSSALRVGANTWAAGLAFEF